jgi:hypothetical protein
MYYAAMYRHIVSTTEDKIFAFQRTAVETADRTLKPGRIEMAGFI